MTRTQGYLDDYVYTQIRIMASQQGVPAAELIRKYLECGIEKCGKRETARETFLRIASHAAKHGPKDLSTNHDDIYN